MVAQGIDGALGGFAQQRLELGEQLLDPARWQAWDAVELIGSATQRLPLLIDQGADDEFLSSQLRPELLQSACAACGHPLSLLLQPGYDHSYYFVATFIGEHIAHHAAALRAD